MNKNSDEVIIHLHVPKCAGSSVNNTLFTYFRQRSIPSTDVERLGRFERMSPEERDQNFDCMAGHYMWGLHEKFGRDVVYISVIRHPLDRICSYFNYVHLRPEHPFHNLFASVRDINEVDIEWIRENPGVLANFRNHMCHVYQGHQLAPRQYERFEARVISEMKAQRFVIGGLHHIERWLQSRGILDASSNLPLVNESASHERVREFVWASPETLTPRAKAMLLRLNALDTKLMEAVYWTNYVMGWGDRPRPVEQASIPTPNVSAGA